MKKAVFLDRDGTLNCDEGHYYVYREEDFVLNKGVIQGLKILQKAAYLLIVITNQGGVAKGLYTTKDVEAVHDKMRELLREEGVEIAAVYYCPHHDSVADCECRKPSPTMLLRAITDYDLDAAKCYMIGDSDRDIQAAQRAGVKAYKIKTNSSIVEVCEKIVANED